MDIKRPGFYHVGSATFEELRRVPDHMGKAKVIGKLKSNNKTSGLDIHPPMMECESSKEYYFGKDIEEGKQNL